jgi:hypothetical protein
MKESDSLVVRLINASAAMLLVNADVYTAWHARKRVIVQGSRR